MSVPYGPPVVLCPGQPFPFAERLEGRVVRPLLIIGVAVQHAPNPQWQDVAHAAVPWLAGLDGALLLGFGLMVTKAKVSAWIKNVLPEIIVVDRRKRFAGFAWG